MATTVDCSKIGPKTGRILSGLHTFDAELAKCTIKDVTSEGYEVLVEHNNGCAESVYIEGDLPTNVYFHRA